MIIVKTVSALESIIGNYKMQRRSIGFVPTMGALHQGHISLIEACKRGSAVSVCSIFVNPTQFNNASDFEKYPLTVSQDIDKLEKAGCDLLFLPPVKEIYPDSYVAPHYDLGYLETILEGEFRPGHYQGVCQVVELLLRSVKPDHLYLGQKDYQQCMVIKKMVEDRNIHVEIRVEDTVREKDGLAMSSRNVRLTPQERLQASALFRALSTTKSKLGKGPTEAGRAEATAILQQHGFRPEYIETANADTLEIIHNWDGKTPVVILAAAYIGDVRLIDNVLLKN